MRASNDHESSGNFLLPLLRPFAAKGSASPFVPSVPFRGQRILLSLLCLLCLFVATGCSVVTARRTPDGVLTVSQWRLLWKSEAVNVTAGYAAAGLLNLQPATFNLQLSLGQSASDDAAVAAVTEGAVKGALGRP